MTDRRSYVLAGLAVFAVAAAMRTIPLYWSPLPHFVDGFRHAADARATLAAGHVPLSTDFRADHLVVTVFIATTSLVTDEAPLSVVQPLFSLLGASLPLVGMAFARRLGEDRGWPGGKVHAAALATGLLLAVQGLFLRHSSIPDTIPIGQLFAFLAVLSLHRLLDRRAATLRWLVPLAVFVAAFPIVHTFSGFHAGIAVTALAAAEIARRPNRRTAAIGVGATAAFWTIFVAYYEAVERVGVLAVPYVDRVQSHPGLFLAWLVLALVGVVWLGATSTRVRRAVLLAPVAAGVAIVAANVLRPVFPGTIGSPPVVVAAVGLLVVPMLFAVYAADGLSNRHGTSTVVLALVAAPVTVSYFSMTASLTPEFFATVQLSQSFAHVPLSVLVGLGAAGVAWRARGVTGRRGVRSGLLAVLAVSTLLTVPVAFVALDTLHHPDTTRESEFAAVEHAARHTATTWTTDHRLMRVGRTTFDARVRMGPARTWTVGGPSPACPMLSFDRWVTHAANFWPASPASVDRARYEATLAERQVVYAAGGREPSALSVPRGDRARDC